jgi:hypothetical protein
VFLMERKKKTRGNKRERRQSREKKRAASPRVAGWWSYTARGEARSRPIAAMATWSPGCAAVRRRKRQEEGR